ncbi:M23 family metallopeptidase [Pontimicrobium sp. MEBiC01747]|jgi:murein DD-endopeptidase MepM/ murein hydrolase activator NlpD
MKFHIKTIVSVIVILVIVSCKMETKQATEDTIVLSETTSKITIEDTTKGVINYRALFKSNPNFVANSFDFPVGKPDAKGYYNAQPFGENNHLGDDWNGVGGGNSDLGDPIYSIANGYIAEVKNYEGGWGNVAQIVHYYNNKLYKSLYAHCDSIVVTEGSFVKKGDQIATIGNCNGIYLAHLHLEIRDALTLDIGNGYSNETIGYLDPTLFIKNNRE